jgi:hypothetical protein
MLSTIAAILSMSRNPTKSGRHMRISMSDPNSEPLLASTVEAAWQELLRMHQGSHIHQRTSSRPFREMYFAVDDRRRPGMLVLGPPSRTIRTPKLESLDISLRVRNDGQVALEVTLNDQLHRHVFAQLVAAISNDFVFATQPGDPVDFVLNKLQTWQQLLDRGSRTSLSIIEQQGLWGELTTIRNFLEHCSAGAVIKAWKGPTHDAQDFRFGSAWVECKVHGEGTPEIRVSNLQQLDSGPVPLFLVVHSIEEHPSGSSLGAKVASIRERIAVDAMAVSHFEKLLALYGYSDTHDYQTLYRLSRTRWYRVADGFPRLATSTVPAGVLNAEYRLQLKSLANYAEDEPRIDS